MGFILIDADQTIIKKVKLEMTPPAPVDGWPGQPNQQAIINQNVMQGIRSGQSPRGPLDQSSSPSEIPIQFPPRIRGNSKTSRWTEEYQKTYEPVAIWMGADATELNVELKYVITGGVWTADKIAKAVHTVMGYFYRHFDAGQKGAPLIKVTLYKVAPAQPKISTWRMINADVQYGDELILDGADIYPQVTTVAMVLKMVTQIGDNKAKLVKQDLRNAPKYPRQEWY